AERLERSLASGQAAERFARMVAALGGPGDLLERPATYLPAAPVRRPVHQDGTVAGIATRALGLAVIELGGGRTRPEDRIDPRVGFTDLAGPGSSGGLLGIVHAADEASADRAEAALRAAYRMGEAPAGRPTVIEAVGAR
ncbi:MAG: thymidine phosphorylase, partial [Actinomycetospora chiangmaiensis]|nr:thymidine phosphorylase [Actinomycetospora chiangmaiensis]